MKLRLRSAVVGAVATALIAAPLAWAAGLFPGFPIVGSPAYCTSISGTGTGTGSSTFPATPGTSFGQGSAGQSGQFGSVCNVTANAGPNGTTGMELIPADTQLGSGQQPQTVLIPSGLVGSTNVRVNRLIGGDFTTNLWQRGTTPVSAASPTTTVIGPDRFGVYSASSQVTVSKQTGASDTMPTLGYYASARVARPSAQTGTGDICMGQVLDKNASADLIGKNAVFSFYGLAGGNFSPTGGNLKVTVAYYTAADSATPLTNTDAWFKGTVTGYQAAVAGASNGTTASVTAGVATVQITSTWTRYAVYAPIPAANASGTAVVGVGVSLCMTPVGTAGTNDWFEVIGTQLQAMPSTVTASMPNGITSPTGFERRPAQYEADLQYFYSQVLTDGATTTVYPGFCSEITANTTGKCTVFLQPMREVPSTTVGTATSFSMRTAADAANACTTLAAVATSNTTSSAGLSCTAAGTVAVGVASPFVGANTGSLLTFSAEP